MNASRTYIEHTADILFKAEAGTISKLFEQCALAVEESQVELAAIKPKEKRDIVGENENVDYLLFDFLDDLLYYKDAEQLIFSSFEIDVSEDNNKYHLHCVAHGEKIDTARHEQKVDVKAITMHMFEIKKTKKGWEAKVLLDI
ncbi:hypothetical protein COV17_04610 [Candidatus Woesearchaeota archaeon CG10_big_fil_rev_8_21_14_0_10_36_11]|nr:MAG: hypothetical protein COV17_04610 [Candidatus Woesearchaeota archaeon CG10_big_fil_rev_8_21_14_0_10_36_11]